MDPLELNWNKIALELEKELGREPRAREVQKSLTEKYWNMVDIIEKNKPKDND